MSLYVRPREASRLSTPSAAGRKIAKLLDAIEALDGPMNSTCRLVRQAADWRARILDELRNEGWRASVNRHDRWQVLPPK